MSRGVCSGCNSKKVTSKLFRVWFTFLCRHAWICTKCFREHFTLELSTAEDGYSCRSQVYLHKVPTDFKIK